MTQYDDRHWHLDKRIPVAIITAIALQTFGAVWWAASLSARVDVLESRWTQFEGALARLRIQENNSTRLNTRLESLYTRLDRIEQKLDKLLEHQRRTPQ